MTMKIAHFIDTRTYGGAESLVIRFCRRTLESGDIFVALHFGENKLVDKLAEYDVQQVILPNEKYYKSTKTLPIFSWSLRKILQDLKIDVLHSHLYGPICAGALSCWHSGIRHIGTLHDSYTILEKPSRAWILKLASVLDTHIVSVSGEIQNAFLKTVDIPMHALSVIHNGTDIMPGISRSRKTELRDKLGISDDNKLVISVGRLTPIKGYNVLLEAWKNLPDRGKRKLLIVGEGPEKTNLLKQCNDENISDSVIFSGFRDDVSDLLSISDLFVLLSHSEGLSCSITEAIAHGLPCVVTDVGGNSEIVQNHVNGILVKPGDIDSASEAIDKILGDNKLAMALENNSRRIALENFNEELMLEQYWDLYTNREK